MVEALEGKWCARERVEHGTVELRGCLLVVPELDRRGVVDFRTIGRRKLVRGRSLFWGSKRHTIVGIRTR